MKETIALLGKILTNILTVLYEPFGFSLLISFLAMFFYLYAYEPIHAGKGCHGDLVSEVQRECVLPETVPIDFRDFDDLVQNAVESEPVAKSFVKCHGRLGHLGDRERRAETYN